MSTQHRRSFLSTVGTLAIATDVGYGQKKMPQADGYHLPAEHLGLNQLSTILGRAADTSITINVMSAAAQEGYFEYGTVSGKYTGKSKPFKLTAGQPLEVKLSDLKPNSQYVYRVQTRKPNEMAYQGQQENQFHTQRQPGSTFTFCVQGDSHPERPQMSEPNLYARTLQHASNCHPDLYFCMGDDFSINKVRSFTPENLAAPYLLQRPFLSLAAQSASLYLVNGNHEQASLFNFNQMDERKQIAIGVQNARNKLFPMPATESIYAGDDQEFKGIGPLRDYFAWTWGDALFVVLDNYWHSPSQVDTGLQLNGKKGDDKKNRDWWGISIGDAQYKWFKKTLEQSKAKYKFVFAHHVLGTGRGGVEASELYEWGGVARGKGANGDFKTKRPGWELPIHQLMVKHGVSIFFQGHDHLYARQERDGVIYQEVPLPADPFYATHNDDVYTSGKKIANSGYLKIHVSPKEATVEYVRCWLPKDETATQKTGTVAHHYSISPRA